MWVPLLSPLVVKNLDKKHNGLLSIRKMWHLSEKLGSFDFHSMKLYWFLYLLRPVNSRVLPEKKSRIALSPCLYICETLSEVFVSLEERETYKNQVKFFS